MQITILSWTNVVVLGLLAGMFAPVGSWRTIASLEVIGILAVVIPILVAAHGDISSPLVAKLLLFDDDLRLTFGNFQYPLIALGYFLMLASTCHCLRKLFRSKGPGTKQSNGPGSD